MNLPNILTMVRMLLIPVFVYCFYKYEYVLALVIFVSAEITDLLDGYLARKNHQITSFGKLMDPLADKLLVISALACFVWRDMIPAIFLIFVLAKEVIQIGIACWLYKKNIVVFAKKWGKIATVFFACGIGLTFLSKWVAPLHEIVLWVALAFSVIAAISYMKEFLHKNTH